MEIREIEGENALRKIEKMVVKVIDLKRRNVELINKVNELTNNIREMKNWRVQNLTTFENEIGNLTKQMRNLLSEAYSRNASSNDDENECDDFSMEEIESISQLFQEEKDKLAEQLRALREEAGKLEAEVQYLTDSQ